MNRPPPIGVIGPGTDAPEDVLAYAAEVGRLLAGAGATVITGGLGGVLEGAGRGAAEGFSSCRTTPAARHGRATHPTRRPVGGTSGLSLVAKRPSCDHELLKALDGGTLLIELFEPHAD